MDFNSRLNIMKKRINDLNTKSEDNTQDEAQRNKAMKNSLKRRHKDRVRWSNIWGLKRRKVIYEGEEMFEEIMAKCFSEPMKSISLHV